MPTRPAVPRKKPVLLALLLLGFALWITGICVSIAHEPPEGSPSADTLRTDLTEAVRDRDADRLQNLFAPDTVGDDYAETLLPRLTDAGVTNPPATRQAAADGDFLHLKIHPKATAPDGRPTCLTWQVTQADDRWYADGVLPLTPPACP
ncbi:hypothetical protein GCM10010329_32570 [Streptomyces spiroverticillatus]|uniref:Uncharacterized protein n=1 Tax=Streptomyces finlayi TaxID=67296 RepID=A0A918WWP0_9ACTN|nr:hypothetical protein [Streptomyces finlayi]GHA07324.1 hypothetical protein GCM10010329_32570 [Streptomyces spiroverticillatus]GHC90741.1 hypothetical protein GCM10010334_24980 [Streptomyces finlayi]